MEKSTKITIMDNYWNLYYTDWHNLSIEYRTEIVATHVNTLDCALNNAYRLYTLP